MKVLLIEDNEDISNTLAEYLTLKGYECTISNDGKDGLEKISSKNYDVVLLDLVIPKLSGHQIIGSLEKNGKLRDQKIIVLTATSIDKSEKENLVKRGIHKCLEKPIQLNVLLEAIQSSVNS